jgi:hypothetical protein
MQPRSRNKGIINAYTHTRISCSAFYNIVSLKWVGWFENCSIFIGFVTMSMASSPLISCHPYINKIRFVLVWKVKRCNLLWFLKQQIGFLHFPTSYILFINIPNIWHMSKNSLHWLGLRYTLQLWLKPTLTNHIHVFLQSKCCSSNINDTLNISPQFLLWCR